MKAKSLFVSAALFLTTLIPTQLKAEPTEQRFQDLFITAGYATAFGAALGAAALSFSGNPERHLRYVAVGASLGFIGGSLLGSYIIFAPTLVENRVPSLDETLVSHNTAPRQLTVIPVIDRQSKSLTGIAGAMTLLQF